MKNRKLLLKLTDYAMLFCVTVSSGVFSHPAFKVWKNEKGTNELFYKGRHVAHAYQESRRRKDILFSYPISALCTEFLEAGCAKQVRNLPHAEGECP